jgi:A/G-specific adenine glycosylase
MNLQPFKEILGKNKFEVQDISAFYKQQLTHQTIRGRFIRVTIKDPFILKGYKKVGKTALQKLPFPKFISNYLKDKNVSLNLV